MTTLTQEEVIDFGAITGSDESTPKGKFDSKIEKMDSSNLETLSCMEWLTEGEQAQVRDQAFATFLKIKQDESVLDSFGNPAMNGINAAVNSVAAAQRKMRIPEMERITKEMSKNMSDFSRKWNPQDPKFQEAMNNFSNFLKKLVNSAGSFIEDMYIDSQSVYERLDKAARVLEIEKGAMKESVETCRVLYEENEDALRKIVIVIAMMEQMGVHFDEDISRVQAELEKLPKDSVGWRDKREEMETLLELRLSLTTRRISFIQRMQVGWTSSPRLRNMGKAQKSLKERLGMMIDIMVPAMRETIVQWGEMIRGEQAAKEIVTMDNALNATLQGLSEASAIAIPRNMAAALRPMITPATMNIMANSVVVMNDGMLQALVQAKQAYAEVEDSVVKGITLINESTENTQSEVIKLFVSAQETKPLVLEPAPEIPEVALQYATEAKAA